jgi:AcrR family transcriptional regulator
MNNQILTQKPIRTPRPERTYHHGQLREALLEAGECLIDRDGLEGFSLRACAREAGVSHAAPAHHFPDLAALQAALVERAFQRLCAIADGYVAEAGDDPRAVLPVMGVSYIDFALRHPGLYRLMVGWPGLPAAREAGRACQNRIASAVRAVLEAEGVAAGEARVEELTALAWSVFHGYASLALDGRLPTGAGNALDLAGKVLLRLQPLFQPLEKPGG